MYPNTHDRHVPLSAKNKKKKIVGSRDQTVSHSKADKVATTSNPRSESDQAVAALVPLSSQIPPLIIIPETSYWERINDAIQVGYLIVTRAEVCSEGYKILFPSNDHYRCFVDYLIESNINFYIPFEEPLLRVVIRGIPHEIDLKDVEKDLLAKKYPIQAIYRKWGRTMSIRELLFVVLDHNKKGKRIFNMKKLCGLSDIIVQFDKSKPEDKCRIYEQVSRFCECRPMCNPCLNDEGTPGRRREISIIDNPPTCVLCGCDDHTLLNCPNAPEFRKLSPESRSQPKSTTQPIASSNSSHDHANPAEKKITTTVSVPSAQDSTSLIDDLLLLYKYARINLKEVRVLAEKIRSAKGEMGSILTAMIEHSELIQAIKDAENL
ncbi:hypothetical protein ACJJTC_005776 [Scirpophaga incertulas]